jgi:hypothetical protein
MIIIIRYNLSTFVIIDSTGYLPLSVFPSVRNVEVPISEGDLISISLATRGPGGEIDNGPSNKNAMYLNPRQVYSTLILLSDGVSRKCKV